MTGTSPGAPGPGPSSSVATGAAGGATAGSGAATTTGAPVVRVMICDDSATVRGILARLLGADAGIEVVARVADGQQALGALAETRPDVILLDLEMPVMDGMTALPRLLRADPRLAVIVASAVTQRGAAEAMSAMRAGACDYIPKPGADQGGAADPVFRAELLEKVKGWARMRRRTAPPAASAAPAGMPEGAAGHGSGSQGTAALGGPHQGGGAQREASHGGPSRGDEARDEAARSDAGVRPPGGASGTMGWTVPSAGAAARLRPSAPHGVGAGAGLANGVSRRAPPPSRARSAGMEPSGPAPARPSRPGPLPVLLAVGSSTGGPQALAAFLRAMTSVPSVPVVIVQHMPAGFTAMLADHLDRLGELRVAEAREGEPLRAGHAYVAPGDRHLLVERGPGGLVARLRDDPPENFCRPAVDPMLRSAQRSCDGRVLAVILTGMGQDGLEGCRGLAAAGGTVLAQDEASSVVWGMPGAVARAGIARELLPPERLGVRVSAILAGTGAEIGRMAL